MTLLRRSLFAVVFVLLAAMIAPAPAANAGDVTTARFIRIQTDLTAAANDLYTRFAGTSPVTQYGTLRLAAPVTVDGDRFQLEVVVGLEYVDGKGPWSGFMTLSSKKRGTLAMTYEGRTRVQGDGGSRIRGRMSIIGGTGEFANVVGGGRTIATRSGATGAPTAYDTVIVLRPGTPRFVPTSPDPTVNTTPTDVVEARLMGPTGDQHFTALPDGRTYGIGRLTGDGRAVVTRTGAFASRISEVELLAAVDYVDGSGPFTGFVTLESDDGSLIGMRYAGVAQRASDGSTRIRGSLTVIASTGQFAGMRGEGSVEASRTGVVGAPLDTRVALTLRQAR